METSSIGALLNAQIVQAQLTAAASLAQAPLNSAVVAQLLEDAELALAPVPVNQAYVGNNLDVSA
jgi:hypothetical protein